MRRALLLAVVVAGLLLPAGPALAHAVLVSSDPPADGILPAAPERVELTFNEPVQLVGPTDLDVVDGGASPVASGPGQRVAGDARRLEVPIRPIDRPTTYTVRYKVIGADSHVIVGAYVFGVGVAELGEPLLFGAASRGGPAEGSAWSVSARFLEIAALGGLLGLLAFRWLVWGPALGRDGPGRDGACAWARDSFWLGFGVLAVVAMVAEGYLLVVQSATVLGTGVLSALGDTAGIGRVLGETRFGSLVQIRGALLFGVFALGAWQFLSEYGEADRGAPPSPSGRGVPGLLMVALVASVLGIVAAQGHASQAPLRGLQVGTQLAHVAAGATWITGLALVAVTLRYLPRAEPEHGRARAGATLAHFSQVALVAVGLALVSGLVRSIGQLADPAQLWSTDYGLSIVYKLLLLCPIAFLALRNRRVIAALQGVAEPNRATLRMVRRSVGVELVVALAIVVVASVLVAQVPGRT